MPIDFDDMPEWVRRVRDEVMKPEDDTPRCACCGAILLGVMFGDVPESTRTCETCFPLDVLRQLVANGYLTDWPQGNLSGYQPHRDGMNQRGRWTYAQEVVAVLSIYNHFHDTRYRFR